MWGKESGKVIIGNSAGVGEAIHSLVDFDIYMVTMHAWGQLVLNHNGVRDDRDGDPHVFVLLQWCTKVKVF